MQQTKITSALLLKILEVIMFKIYLKHSLKKNSCRLKQGKEFTSKLFFGDH